MTAALSYVQRHWQGNGMRGLEDTYATEENELATLNCCEKFSHKLKNAISSHVEVARREKVNRVIQYSFKWELVLLGRMVGTSARGDNMIQMVNRIQTGKKYLIINDLFSNELQVVYNLKTKKCLSKINDDRMRHGLSELTLDQLRSLMI